MLARADAGITLKRCPVDLDPLVLEVFHEARHLAQHHTLVLEPFQPAKVEGNKDKLKQLLVILLDNALKYTPADGQVLIGMRRLEEEFIRILKPYGIVIYAFCSLPGGFSWNRPQAYSRENLFQRRTVDTLTERERTPLSAL